ncbi:hypothetical protein KBY93_12405 [Synechococcus sp. J7-Johnson]|uniref:hypothetical protein n=1 Tax=Synechococcus sp. J7-Johnson TaxID=2823737 RepID=UPI0020CC3B92|nr:hypothetical protein [Synechococcus sp. J7-Johnson]MCP9841428.1 hypothetical protein [Synechococcus sp. J7-Johnson]
MTLTISTADWTPAIDWLSKAPGAVGLRLSEAIAAFVQAVNANAGNSGIQLTQLKDHTAATGTTSFGYVLRLGHPVNPMVLRYYNTTKSQGSSASSSSASLALGLASNWTDDGLNGGYGTFSTTVASLSSGLSYYGPSGSPVYDAAGRLVVMMDTTPGGKEFFAYNIATTSGDTYAQNHTFILFRSPASSGWSVALLRSQALAGMFESRNFYTWSNNVMVAAPSWPNVPSGLEQLLTTGLGLIPGGNGPGQLFEYRTKQERVSLPSLFWFGSNQITDPRRLSRVTNPSGPGVFYQLGAAMNSGGMDCWILVPSSTAAMAGWNTIGSLSSWQTFPDRLYFGPEVPRGAVLMGPDAGPDFLVDWSSVAMGGPGVLQHPIYSLQQGTGGGSQRPSTGVLWPRGNG